MKSNSKDKIIIWVSIAILLGIGGYFGVKKLKQFKEEKAEKEKKTSESDTSEESVVTPPDKSDETKSSPSAVDTAIAIAYRTWANSTDALIKKYGKKSKYDLDATSNNPTKGTFSRSYAEGKNEFDKYNKSNSNDKSKPSATNQRIFNGLASTTGKPVKRFANGVSYLDQPISGYRTIRIADGQIGGGYNANWVVYYFYKRNYASVIQGNSIGSGYIRIKDGKYDITGTKGIGKGVKVTGAYPLAKAFSTILGEPISLS
tara:strand:- start:5538 stop:6314 length:777 start_codon:yes stop_codon:yes gene_type:complete